MKSFLLPVSNNSGVSFSEQSDTFQPLSVVASLTRTDCHARTWVVMVTTVPEGDFYHRLRPEVERTNSFNTQPQQTLQRGILRAQTCVGIRSHSCLLLLPRWHFCMCVYCVSTRWVTGTDSGWRLVTNEDEIPQQLVEKLQQGCTWETGEQKTVQANTSTDVIAVDKQCECLKLQWLG